MLSHDNLLTSVMGSMTTAGLLSEGGRLLHAAPMFHLADGSAWLGGMFTGCTHVIVPMFTPAAVPRRSASTRSPTSCWCRR